MSPAEILYTIIIGPLKLFFEIVFSCAYNVTSDPGLTIVIMSLTINILILPLYMRADALQEEERDLQKRLEKGVSHIKKTFKGDERMMLLQTYTGRIIINLPMRCALQRLYFLKFLFLSLHTAFYRGSSCLKGYPSVLYRISEALTVCFGSER